MIRVNFEVFGTVQGVFFRKVLFRASRSSDNRSILYIYTEKEAKKLGLRGWCKNTDSGTVVGEIEGENSKVEEMKRWLKETGSPQSRIDQTVFSNEKEIDKFSFESFDIVR